MKTVCVICDKPQRDPWVLEQDLAIRIGELNTLWKVHTNTAKLKINKKKDNPIKKRVKDISKHFTKEDRQLTDKHEKFFNLISHQASTN